MGATTQQAADRLEGRRILIVEDEMLIAMELENLLRQHGCCVVGLAPSVARAVAFLERERPDAVLLDLNLNGQPAIPVAKALRARGIPFVVVTGYGAARSWESELRDAPRVAKPVKPQQLTRALGETLGLD